jgi:hypothetical protein
MTRKELATEIYRMDEQKTSHKCSEKEWVKRALNGIGGAKGFLKPELEDMYNRRIAEVN